MILVTGGLGFIGNELVRQLRRTGDVEVLDNRNRVAPRIDDLKDIRIHNVDITSFNDVRETILGVKPDVVYHMAAIHYIPECNADPERTLRVNVEATHGVLRACVEAKVGHVLVASSGAVYADSPDPLTESSKIDPVDIYGRSKYFMEQLCGWCATDKKLPITVLRLFNNYGPRETNAHIIPEVVTQIRRSNTLRLGNIRPIRDYIHTRDTAKALRLLGEQPPTSLRTVNVASGQHTSVEELIETMGSLLGRSLVVETDASRFRTADKLVQIANIEMLKKVVGWQPEIHFQEGLADLLTFEGFEIAKSSC